MRLGSVGVLAFVLASWHPQSLADRTVPTGNGLTLTLPVAGNAAAELAKRILSATNIPSGIEMSPPEAGDVPPRIDRPIADSLAFDGWVVRAALDKLVTLDPRYEWEESDGRIILRSVAQQQADGLLQRRIPPVSLSNTTQAAAVEALARAIAPTRAPGGVFVVGGPVVSGSVDAGQPRADAPSTGRFSVSFGGTSVLAALNALASASGGSWTVTYDAPEAGPDSATISLSSAAATTGAVSPIAMTRARVARANRLLVPVTSELATVVTWYGLRAKLQTGFIRVPGDRRDSHTESYPPLDLTDLNPAEALDRIVALDARYEWTRDDGLYLVRPRREVVDTTPLDMPVEAFSAQGIGTEAVLTRIVRLLAVEDGGGVSAGNMWSGAPDEREIQRRARERPLTFSVRRTTVRGLLNELCREEGTLSWRASLQPDQKRGLLITLELQSRTGWGISRTFVAPPWEPPGK